MASEDFARMVRAAMEERGISRNRLGYLIGVLPDGRTIDATGIRLMLEGRRRNYDTALVTRLIEILDLDPAIAYEAAGVWPEGLTVDGYRQVLADARAEQQIDGRVRGSTRPCARDLGVIRPHRATSPIRLMPALPAAA